MATLRPRRLVSAALLAVTVLGLMLRLSGLGHLDFWYDEIELRNYALTGSALYVPTEPPLMAWLMYGVMSLVKSADALVFHLVPAILGALAVVPAFLLARRVTGRDGIALLVALLTAISPMAIYYSREARPYALLILLSTVVYWAAVRANARDSVAAWSVYAAALCVCGFSHLLTNQIAAALGLFAVAQLVLPAVSGEPWSERIGRFRRSLLATLVGGLAGVLWFVPRYVTDPAIQANRTRIFASSVYSYGVAAFVREAVVNLGPGPVGQRFGAPAGVPDLVGGMFLALFLAGLWRLVRLEQRAAALMLSLIVVVPLAAEYLMLGEKSSWDWMRWISHVLVPFLVVVGVGIDAIARARHGWIGSAVIAAAVVGGVLPHAIAPLERPDYRQNRDIAAYLADHSRELRGVMIPPYQLDIPSDADQRIMDTYYYHKRETLPVYALTSGRLRRATLAATRRNIAWLPRPGDDAADRLDPGRYAVLTRRPLTECAVLLRSFDARGAVARQTSPVMPGLTICDVERTGDPAARPEPETND